MDHGHRQWTNKWSVVEESATDHGQLTTNKKEQVVSHYTLEELVARWRREELTVEQMIGQLLLVQLAQQRRLRELERRLPPDDESVTAPARQSR
jgi:hypothetical protein